MSSEAKPQAKREDAREGVREAEREAERKSAHTGEHVAQWAGLLAAPLAWALQMQAAYVMVPWECQRGQNTALHLLTLAALLLAAAGGLLSWRNWRHAGKESPETEGEAEASGRARGRSRFMAALGLLTSLMFFLTIVAQAVPTFILHPCEG